MQQESTTIQVKVTVQKNGGKYAAIYEPKIIKIYDPDTILNFKLTAATDEDIVIKSVTIAPEDQGQLSLPSISRNGRQVTLSDLNTLAETFNLSFSYKTIRGELIELDRSGDMGIVYPQVENNPPGMTVAMSSMEVDGGPENNPPG